MKLPIPDEKIQRDAFLYFDHSVRSPEDEFAQCASCRMFVPKANVPDIDMDLCILHGSHVEVGATYSCGLYAVWPKGEPNPEVVKDHASELNAGLPGSVTAEQSGLVDRKVRCENCEFFDDKEDVCELYQALNAKMPETFDLDEFVEPYGCCNANTEID